MTALSKATNSQVGNTDLVPFMPPPNVICNILSQIDGPVKTLITAMHLRSTSKEFKANIDKNAEFGIPFLNLYRINTTSQLCQEILKTEHWSKVFQEWITSPLRIVLFDYSLSMEELRPLDGRSHLSVAKDMLTSLFERQQNELRTKMIVYLFANHFQKFKLGNPSHFTDLSAQIDAKSIHLDRRYTKLKKIFNEFAKPNISILNKEPFIRNFEIILISDIEFADKETKCCIDTLNAKALQHRNRKCFYALRLMPTSSKDKYESQLHYLHKNLIQAKKREHIDLFVDEEPQPPKRQKIDTEEIPETPPLPDIFPPPNSPTNNPFPYFDWDYDWAL